MSNFNINENPQGMAAVQWCVQGLKILWRRVNGISGSGGGGTVGTLQQVLDTGNTADIGTGTASIELIAASGNTWTVNGASMTFGGLTYQHVISNYADQIIDTFGDQVVNGVGATSFWKIIDRNSVAFQLQVIVGGGVNVVYTQPGSSSYNKTLNFDDVSISGDTCIALGNVSGLVAIDGNIRSRSVAGTTDTFVIGDVGKSVESASISGTTFIVPTNASVPFLVGAVIYPTQIGTGKLTIAAAGGVTINSKSGNLSAGAQYVQLALEKRATNTWLLVGDLIT